MSLDADRIRRTVREALDEDIGSGDVTTESLVAPDALAQARIEAKESGIVAGIPVAIWAFKILDADLQCQSPLQDGQSVQKGDHILLLHGSARAILSAERVALNFLQRLSGIATLTNRFVRAVDGTGVRILDTRKTTPGLRYLEKYAVTVGGGHNHRMGLYDMILIKDNHIRVAGQVASAVQRVRADHEGILVEIEASDIEQVMEATRAGVDRIMLDNMSAEQIQEAVKWIQRQHRGVRVPQIEVSGNITLENVRQVAMAGVDDISVGSLTHSSAALDMSLKITNIKQVG